MPWNLANRIGCTGASEDLLAAPRRVCSDVPVALTQGYDYVDGRDPPGIMASNNIDMEDLTSTAWLF